MDSSSKSLNVVTKQENFLPRKISLSKKSKITLILRVMIISLCCIFFPLGAIIDRGLEEIEINYFLNNKFFSINNSETFQWLIDKSTLILGSNYSIMVYISIIYSIVHPFTGLRLILVSCISQYLIIILEILYEAHRPFWDSDEVEAIECKNTYANPSLELFYLSFFYLYVFISFNTFKKKKFTFIQKIIIMVIYLIFLGIYFFFFVAAFFLYYHQIVYTYTLSVVVIAILIDYNTKIHNFIYNSLKNLYNTRVYKMQIFYFVTGLFVLGYLGSFFVEDTNESDIKNNLRNNEKCSEVKINTFGTKEGILDTSFLASLVGAFWGASYTVEKKVGKWWSNKSRKITLIKTVCILIVCGVFIAIFIFLEGLKDRFELLFSIKIVLYFFESYCVFGLMPLFFQKIKINEEYISQSYEKINVKLTNENDVQLFRKSIFINENKGKKDLFVVVDKVEKEKEKIIDTSEKKSLKIEENNIDNIPINIENKEDISFDKNEEIKNIEEEEIKKEIEPSSTIIKNMAELKEEEGDYEFEIDSDKLTKSTGSIDKLKEDLINNDEE